jgi:hypothetical protein
MVGRNGDSTVLPAYPRVHVWTDVLGMVGAIGSHRGRVRPSLEKHWISLRDEFQPSPAPLRAVYVLTPANSDDLVVSDLHGSEKLMALLLNLYRPQFAVNREWHLAQCAALAQHVHVARVRRPLSRILIEELVSIVERDVRNR